jgi:hypothetical protein
MRENHIAASRCTVGARRWPSVNVLRAQTEAPLDWEPLKDEAAHLGSAQAFIDRVLADAGSGSPG